MAAILEERGFTNIHVVLLDSHLSYLANQKSRPDNEPSFVDENVIKILREKKYDEEYIKNVVSALGSDMELLASPISAKLKSTKVTLFKASQLFDGADIDTSYTELGYTPANNIDLLADNLKLIRLNCQHLNILETSREVIVEYLLSETFTTVEKLDSVLV